MEGLITFVYREPGHQGEPGEISNSLTVVDRQWSYCHSGANGGDMWVQVEGTTVDALRRTPGPSQTQAQEQGAIQG
jgi:hypothetical protein